MSDSDDALRLGRETIDKVYGEGFSEAMPPPDDPLTYDVIAHLFGEIWARPALSIRDRRLLVMGATAALGRADLLAVQIRGALANEELTEEQLQEAALHLTYYVGVGNAGAMREGTRMALDDPTPGPPR
jgi:4-carboxymuconolactone decarboxylase